MWLDCPRKVSYGQPILNNPFWNDHLTSNFCYCWVPLVGTVFVSLWDLLDKERVERAGLGDAATAGRNRRHSKLVGE